MATEDEIVLEDDWNYLAVCPTKGPARIEDGTVLFIEVGRGGEAPHDHKCQLFPVDAEGAQALIEHITAALEADT